MRGAETSNTLLPCWRGVHLHKAASFKMIFEKIQTKHTYDAKMDPKTIEQTFKNNPKHAERHRKTSPRMSQTFRFWLPFGTICLKLSSSSVFAFATSFSEPLRGYPLDRFWSCLGPPWSYFPEFLADFRSNSAVNDKDSRATNGTNHTPGLNKMGSAELTKG